MLTEQADRGRGIMDVQKSIAYIQQRGTELEKARLNCILNGKQPDYQVIRNFNELQNIDGGYPFGMRKGNLSTINETTVALWWLEELDLLASQAGKHAYSFLVTSQQADGSWNENPYIAQYELPAWNQLNDPKTILYLSAYATYWLVLGGYTGLPNFRKAIHFLIRNQDETGKFYGYLHTTWIATSVFLMSGTRYRNIADMGLKVLANTPTSELDDSQIAWAVDCLSRGGLTGEHPFVSVCLAQLLQRQKEDGSWAAEDGENFAVGATIQAIKVLKRYGFFSTPIGGE
ncbi:MAG: hypothetical protein C3F13_03645 [Anaerolineales bacterium]|nr:MAG: hypothetical protein C3F13_03645 [Anaerolineales bacterium]